MDQEVIRNDTTYISTSLAAELTGYDRDYVGQLARDGYFDSTKIGRKRFVDREEFIAYALKNKSELSVSDLPENHIPDSLSQQTGTNQDQKVSKSQPTQNTSTETKNKGDQSAAAHRKDEVSNEADQSIFLAPESEEVGGFQTRPTSEDGLPERMSSRWQRRRDNGRNQQRADRNTAHSAGNQLRAAVFAAALVVMSLSGIVFAASDNVQDTASQTVASVGVTAERAYEGVGIGLNQKLAEQSPLGVVTGSVAETAGLIAGYSDGAYNRFSRRIAGVGESRDRQSGQKAAAASVGGVLTESLRFVGDEITRQFGWVGNAGSTRAALASDSSYLASPESRLAQTTSSGEQISQPDDEDVSTTTSGTSADGSQTNTESEIKTINTASSTDKALVVPAPTSTEAREQTEQEIREQFSDPVSISTSSSRSGVIQPQFEDRSGDEYLYIMMPKANKGSAEGTRE